jgi:hypothetical protein
MSSVNTNDDMAQTSFLNNLKNNIVYKANIIAYNPDANKYVTKKTKQETETQKEQKEQKENISDNESNTFSIRRLIKTIITKFTETFGSLFIPFMALMVTMLVTNELIIYSIPIRIIFFIITLSLCIFVPTYTILLIIVYSLKALYKLYINTTVPLSDKKPLLPPIFALLPIKLTEPESKLGRILMYPFTYPKSQLGEMQLSNIMKTYENDLQVKFKEFDKYKSMPYFSKLINKIHIYLENMHINKEETNNNEIINETNK